MPFAHESEESLSVVLDFLGVRWLYEPTTFGLEWDTEGNMTEGFTPDFLLPDHGIFLELTTLKQPLTTAKHRKIRKLRERYPGVYVKIIHRKDYLALMRRYA